MEIDTSYQTFGFLLEELRRSLHSLHSFVDAVDEDAFANDTVLRNSLVGVVDVLSCLKRDLACGKIDYANQPSKVVNVKAKDTFVTAFRKSYVDTLNVIDDHYLENLYAPLWVRRHELSNGQSLWVLSNVCNEMSVLLTHVQHTSTIVSLLQQRLEH